MEGVIFSVLMNSLADAESLGEPARPTATPSREEGLLSHARKRSDMKGLSRPLTPAAPRVNVAPARLSGFAFSLRVRWNQRPASTTAMPARKTPPPIRGSQCHEDDVPSALRPEQCRAGGPVRLLREPTSPTV